MYPSSLNRRLFPDTFLRATLARFICINVPPAAWYNGTPYVSTGLLLASAQTHPTSVPDLA
eukprot:3923103-Rhodomonas_salina.1